VKIAYLIIAHDNPAHLARLTRALSSRTSSTFIHIDQKSKLANFAEASGDNVHFIQERVSAHWGDFSLVEATLNLLATALSAPERFDYFVLMGGTDYPLRSAPYIRSFFERHSGQEFINIAPIGSAPLESHMSRITIYRSRPCDPLAVKLSTKLARILKFPLRRDHRPVFGELIPYGGSQWWALSRPACEYIRSFLILRPAVVEFFKHTRCPDEMFFQTVLGNSTFKSKALRNITYTDWSERCSSPANMSEKHLERFESDWPITLDDDFGKGEALFARKFSDAHCDLTARIDRMATESELAAADAP
jgi:hypothetical protein